MASNNSDKHIDTQNIDERLLCKLCHNLFIDPVMTECNDTYCGACIKPKIRSGSHCPSPSCNQLLTTSHLKPIPSMSLTISILNNLKVRCRLCGETNLNRRDFDEHIQESCPQYHIDCSSKRVGCPWFGPRNKYPEHIQTCLFEKLRPMADIFYQVIENQSFHIKELQKQTQQQKTEFGQQNTQVEEHKTQFEQQATQLGQLNTQ
ncbi:unnamed protein product, partial [Rotaria socialis]